MHNEFILSTKPSPGSIQRCALLLGLLLIAPGCGNDGPAVAPVRGVVELDGKPLTGFDRGGVTFTPVAGPLAKGLIDPADGSFELTTYNDGDGAIVGPAMVSLRAAADNPGGIRTEKHTGSRSVLPKDFADRDLSGLTYEVVGGKTNVVRIKISSDGSGTVEAE